MLEVHQNRVHVCTQILESVCKCVGYIGIFGANTWKHLHTTDRNQKKRSSNTWKGGLRARRRDQRWEAMVLQHP